MSGCCGACGGAHKEPTPVATEEKTEQQTEAQ